MKIKDLLLETVDGKNLHLEHLDDEIWNRGYNGAVEAINYLEGATNLLKGDTTQRYFATKKWDGCIHPDLQLNTDKGQLRIEEVIDRHNGGELFNVLSHNMENSIDEMVPIIAANKQVGHKQWIEIELENGDLLRLTEDHEVFTTNRGWIKAKDLTIEDDIKEPNK